MFVWQPRGVTNAPGRVSGCSGESGDQKGACIGCHAPVPARSYFLVRQPREAIFGSSPRRGATVAVIPPNDRLGFGIVVTNPERARSAEAVSRFRISGTTTSARCVAKRSFNLAAFAASRLRERYGKKSGPMARECSPRAWTINSARARNGGIRRNGMLPLRSRNRRCVRCCSLPRCRRSGGVRRWNASGSPQGTRSSGPEKKWETGNASPFLQLSE